MSKFGGLAKISTTGVEQPQELLGARGWIFAANEIDLLNQAHAVNQIRQGRINR